MCCNCFLLFLLIHIQIYRKYPNKNMSIGIRAVDKPPFINITAEGATFTVPGEVDFFVLDGEYMPLAFSLGVVSETILFAISVFLF